jgi:hypothetical protein
MEHSTWAYSEPENADLADRRWSEIGHVGEIRQPQPAGRMLLPEDDVPIGPLSARQQRMRRSKVRQIPGYRLRSRDLVENSDRPQAGYAPAKRHDLAVSNIARDPDASASAVISFCSSCSFCSFCSFCYFRKGSRVAGCLAQCDRR